LEGRRRRRRGRITLDVSFLEGLGEMCVDLERMGEKSSGAKNWHVKELTGRREKLDGKGGKTEIQHRQRKPFRAMGKPRHLRGNGMRD